MANEPAKPGTISGDSFCALTGYTDRQHRNIAAKGYFPNPDRGQYQSAASIAGMFRYLREMLARKSDTEKVLKVQTAEVKLELAKAELATAQDLSVPKKSIGPALRNLCLHQRSLFQRKLESELAPKLTGLKPLEISAAMSAAVDDVCAVFFYGVRDWLETDPAPAAATLESPAQPSPAALAPAKKSRLKKPSPKRPRKSSAAKPSAGVPS